MAVTRGDLFVSPSVDIRTKAELDSTSIESGLYICKESVTIKNLTSNRWSVTCLSTNAKNGLHCLTQIWTNVDSNTPRIFTRTSPLNSNTYSEFTSYANIDSDYPIDIVIGTTEPSPETGVYKIFLDIS